MMYESSKALVVIFQNLRRRRYKLQLQPPQLLIRVSRVGIVKKHNVKFVQICRFIVKTTPWVGPPTATPAVDKKVAAALAPKPKPSVGSYLVLSEPFLIILQW